MIEKNFKEFPAELRVVLGSLLKPYVPDIEARLNELFFSPGRGATIEELVTRKDVAQRLNLSLPSVDRLLASGELPHCKIRRSVRVSEADLSEFIAASKKA